MTQSKQWKIAIVISLIITIIPLLTLIELQDLKLNIMIISIPIKAKENYIKLCQKTKDSKTEDEFKRNSVKAKSYSDAIKDICGLSVWGEIVREADMQIGNEYYPVCCGVPLIFDTSKLY